jgi:hypothetical protein
MNPVETPFGQYVGDLGESLVIQSLVGDDRIHRFPEGRLTDAGGNLGSDNRLHPLQEFTSLTDDEHLVARVQHRIGREIDHGFRPKDPDNGDIRAAVRFGCHLEAQLGQGVPLLAQVRMSPFAR